VWMVAENTTTPGMAGIRPWRATTERSSSVNFGLPIGQSTQRDWLERFARPALAICGEKSEILSAPTPRDGADQGQRPFFQSMANRVRPRRQLPDETSDNG
jgi:hypothetical protein